jgi:hypothetical protein
VAFFFASFIGLDEEDGLSSSSEGLACIAAGEIAVGDKPAGLHYFSFFGLFSAARKLDAVRHGSPVAAISNTQRWARRLRLNESI